MIKLKKNINLGKVKIFIIFFVLYSFNLNANSSSDLNMEGKFLEIKVLESSGFKVLDNASLETLKKWKFTPARIGNKFVDDTVDIPVNFLITN